MLAAIHVISDRKLGRKGVNDPGPATSAAKAEEALAQFQALLTMMLSWADGESFWQVEAKLRLGLNALGVILLELFLIACETKVLETLKPIMTVGGKRFQRRPPQGRSYSCTFGVLRYWRVYMRSLDATEGGSKEGFHPLDTKLGICAERISTALISLATRIATKVSFAQTAQILSLFLHRSPSTEVIERAVLGLGRRAAEFQQSPPPLVGDGDVLVVQIDGKAAPQATDAELEKRRGKRLRRKVERSARHRGRRRRQRAGSKPRRLKGDKSKNGKVAHVVVVYSLKRVGNRLEGPINKRVFASFRPKRAAFATARAEAERRGFGPNSGKIVQLVTDGDKALEHLASEYLPHAEHTIDVMHVVEYLWKAGHVHFREGSDEVSSWVAARKEELYAGKVSDVLREMTRKIRAQRPGCHGANKKRKLEKIQAYIEHRKDKMDYARLRDHDLEIASGIVEGAVNYVIGRRFDQGGMRWIKGRAEALLQLRCIEINHDWDAFIRQVHDALWAEACRRGERPRMLSYEPIDLDLDLEAA